MNNWPFRIGFVVVGIIIAIAYWQFYRTQTQPPAEVAAPVQASKPPAKPVVQYPITATEEDLQAAEPIIDPGQPLPDLKQSDPPMAEVLARLFTDRKLDRFFLLDHFIERFVVMVDNLPNPQLPTNQHPLKKTPGKFLAHGERGQLTIDPANYQRYMPLVDRLAALDKRQVVAVYKRFYPLFQEAYRGLGYPHGNFNDRLIEVIDHLLTTPPVSGPVYLVQPKALYLYADPNLESLSAGRKILLRCGPENAARIKTMLHEYRRQLTEG